MIAITFIFITFSEFSRHPRNVETIIDQDAMFQCEFNYNDSSNEGPCDFIDWHVNNVSVSNTMNPPCPPTITFTRTTNANINKVLASTLTITANNACSNQAEVFCIAILFRIRGNVTIISRTISNTALLSVQSKSKCTAR
jgi:hypothetical protein